MKLHNLFIIGVVFIAFILTMQVLQISNMKKSGKDVYSVSVYDPSSKTDETYITDSVEVLPNGMVKFKDYFGLEHMEMSTRVRIIKY